ncbi:MAG: hypothetical protein RIR18_2367 [Pseudomonadota bacterium]|jgi:hypothetical protein
MSIADCRRDEFADLTTLQQNALRKLLDQPDFTPGEVARLGYVKLQRAEGIGNKGLKSIINWLATHGYELAPQRNEKRDQTNNKKIKKALELLQSHGYQIDQPDSAST